MAYYARLRGEPGRRARRLGIHVVLLEGTVDKLHRMPLRIQRSEGVGAS